MPASTQCVTCRRAVFVSDVNSAGQCCVCEDKTPAKPKPMTYASKISTTLRKGDD